MADTLSFGYVRPADGDRGAPVFSALSGNITQLNAHDHDGVDSDRIDCFDLRRAVVNVDVSSWLSSGSYYRKLVTAPTGYTTANGSDWGKANLRFFLDGGTKDKAEVLPKIEYVSATTFYLYSPFNNQAFNVLFN